jgi:hypothetical protein
MRSCNLLVIFLFLLFACGSRTTSTVKSINCNYYTLQGAVLASGQITADSLQVGYWEFYNDDIVAAKGGFAEGLKFGRWWYDYDNFHGSIDWDTTSILGNVSVNYPNDYIISVDSIGARFVSDDSLIEISITRLPVMDSLEHMRSQIKAALVANDWVIVQQKCTEILFKNRRSYSVFYDVQKGEAKGVYYTMLLEEKEEGAILATMTSKNLPVGKYQYAMVVYLGILENIIIDRKLLLNTTQLVERDC